MSATRPGVERVFLRTAGAVRLWDLVRRDPRLGELALLAALLVLGPLGFALAREGAAFLPAYLSAMAVAFSLPLAIVTALAIHRLYRLENLVERGERHVGTVIRVRRRRSAPERVEITYRATTGTQTAHAYQSLAMIGYVYEGSEVEILVDSDAPKHAVITRAWRPLRGSA